MSAARVRTYFFFRGVSSQLASGIWRDSAPLPRQQDRDTQAAVLGDAQDALGLTAAWVRPLVLERILARFAGRRSWHAAISLRSLF